MDNSLEKSSYVILSIIVLILFKCDDREFYKDIKLVSNTDSYIVLVNKNNKLSKDYIPNDLENISLKYSYENKYLRHEAKEAFEKLSYNAYINGYRIIAVSAYRDYNYQEELFNYYVNEKGMDYALKCSAKSGHSEHQTGLAVDVEGSNFDYDNFENSKDFYWMSKNAHKYGFILRYPKNSEHITGFKYEPWHYRYVGIEVATYIYENNITLEEYIETIK